MGTNYYAVPNRPSCREPIHIGKSSLGWKFCFQTQNNQWDEPPVVWNTFNQVKEWLYKYTVENPIYAIVNEYDDVVTYDELIDLVELKQSAENEDDFTYARNVDGYRFTDEEFS